MFSKITRLIIIAIIIFAVAFVIFFIIKTEGPAKSFPTQQECEQTTGKQCDFKTCDFIPKGKTFEEVCGKDFQKGWMPI